MCSKILGLPWLTLPVSYNNDEIGLSIKGTLRNMIDALQCEYECICINCTIYFLMLFYANNLHLKETVKHMTFWFVFLLPPLK